VNRRTTACWSITRRTSGVCDRCFERRFRSLCSALGQLMLPVRLRMRAAASTPCQCFAVAFGVLACGTTAGIFHLHGNKVCHLDMRLENLQVAIDGRIVISNFFFAKRFKKRTMTTAYEEVRGSMTPVSRTRPRVSTVGLFLAGNVSRW
jgi:hypothetical protein